MAEAYVDPKHPLTMQEAFNIVWRRARDPHRSLLGDGSGTCAYRGDHGRKCFVGVLLPEEFYHSSMEKRSADFVRAWRPEIDEFWALLPFEFLQEIQDIHDETSPVLWKSALRKRIAERWGLEVPG